MIPLISAEPLSTDIHQVMCGEVSVLIESEVFRAVFIMTSMSPKMKGSPCYPPPLSLPLSPSLPLSLSQSARMCLLWIHDIHPEDLISKLVAENRLCRLFA